MREPIGDLKTSVGASLNSASGRALVPLIDLHSIDMSWVLIACPLAYPYEKHAVVGHLQHPVVRPGLGICEHSLPPPLEKSSGNLGRGEAVEQLDGRVKTSRFYPRIPKEAECYHLPFLGEAAETQKDEKVLCSRAAVHRQSQKQSQERILSGCKVVRSCTAVCGPRFLRALDFPNLCFLP